MPNVRRAIDTVVEGSGYEALYALYDCGDNEPTYVEAKEALVQLKEEVEASLKMLRKET